MMEEGLASQIAEFSANFTHKDLEDVARSGRSVDSWLFVVHRKSPINYWFLLP